jgi:hypothetical protein
MGVIDRTVSEKVPQKMYIIKKIMANFEVFLQFTIYLTLIFCAR